MAYHIEKPRNVCTCGSFCQDCCNDNEVARRILLRLGMNSDFDHANSLRISINQTMKDTTITTHYLCVRNAIESYKNKWGLVLVDSLIQELDRGKWR